MSDEAAFLAALKANPADDITRLVYADWLDEHDEPVKAEYLRLIVGLVSTCDRATRDTPEVTRFFTASQTLPKDWCYATADRFMLVLYDYTDKVRTIILIHELTAQGLGEAKAT